MKKITQFLLDSGILFGGYLLASLPLMMLLQTVMRLFVKADSRGESVWKAVFLYLVLWAISAIYLHWSSADMKRDYLAATESTAWSLRVSILYSLRRGEFWSRLAGFSVWPLVLPKLFGVFKTCYAGDAVLKTPLPSLLNIAAVILPFALLSLIAWCVVLRIWHGKRLRK